MQSMHSASSMVQEKGSRERCRSWTVMHAQCNSALSSGFPISQSNAEALDRWGGKIKHRLISYFLSNTSAKNYCNRIVYVKTIATQMWDVFETRCRMWANAQRDGRPAEYRRCLLNAAVWLTPTTRVPYSNAANIGERKTSTQSEFCTLQNYVNGQEPTKIYISYSVPTQVTAKHRAKFGWQPLSDVGVVTNQHTKPVEICGKPISSTNGPKFTILWKHLDEILLLNKFFSDCRYTP